MKDPSCRGERVPDTGNRRGRGLRWHGGLRAAQGPPGSQCDRGGSGQSKERLYSAGPGELLKICQQRKKWQPRVDEGLVEGAADQLTVVQLRYDATKNRHGRSSGNKGNDSSEGHAEPDRMWRWFRQRELRSRLLGEHDAANGKDHVSQQV